MLEMTAEKISCGVKIPVRHHLQCTVLSFSRSRVLFVFLLALCQFAEARGRDGNVEAGAGYKSRRAATPIDTNFWKIFAPQEVLLRRSMANVNSEARHELAIHQRDPGAGTGNVCGYYTQPTASHGCWASRPQESEASLARATPLQTS
jgi:hypothetical protein